MTRQEAEGVPEWLRLPLFNYRLSTLEGVSQGLRDKAVAQLVEAIEVRIELARQDFRSADARGSR